MIAAVWRERLLVGACCLAAAGCAQVPASVPLLGARGDNLESRLAIARLCEGQGDTSQARRIYEAALERDPKNSLASHRLAVLAARAGKHGEAETHFQRALAMTPQDAALLSDYGFWLYLQGQHDEAQRVLHTAIEEDPSLNSARTNLALVLGEMGHLEESYALFREVVSEAQAHANLAFVCAQRGDLNRAEEHYHRALNADPNLRPAAEALLQLAKQPRNKPPRIADHPAARAIAEAEESDEEAVAAAPAEQAVQQAAFHQPANRAVNHAGRPDGNTLRIQTQ